MPAWIWEKQLEHFSKDFTVAAIDLRSQGDSGQSTEGHYAFSMAKDIRAVVDALDLQPLVVIGWSLGVPQVVNFTAHLAPRKLVGLVLVDGILGVDPALSFYQSIIDQWVQFQMDRIPHTRKFIESIFKQPKTQEYLDRLFEAAMRTPTNTVMTSIFNYILQDFRSLLPNIKTPTWIATVDGPRLDYMQKMQHSMPNCRLEIFKSAGHALFVDQAEQFNRSLTLFLEDLQNSVG